MDRTTRLYKLFASSELFFCASALLLLWGCFGAFVLKAGFWSVFHPAPFKVLFLLLVVNRALSVRGDAPDRRSAVVLNVGILIALCGAAWNYAGRFDGVVGLGEGELFSRYDSVEKGAFVKPPAFPFLIGKMGGDILAPDKPGTVELYAGKSGPVVMRSGQRLRAQSGTIVELKSVMAAPRAVIADRQGRELFSSFVKMKLSPRGAVDYFRMEEQPYRFYVSLTGKKEAPLSLKVVRGKLILLRKELALGAKAAFAGMTISFPEIGAWAEFEVSNLPGNAVIAVGLAVSAAGALLRFLLRRKARQ